MINIGLLGLGTVGTGVLEILEERKVELKELIGKELKVKRILVKDINKKRELDLNKYELTSNFEEILSDEDIHIIIEVTSDLEESYQYLKSSLKSGKHIVTANKAIVSKYFQELSDLALKNNLGFLYEASVAGGIPLLKPLKESLALNKIDEVQGILNGTCNYILTRMLNEGLEYDEVLKDAQDLGYAEADPAADVQGHDSLRKLRILGTLALQSQIEEKDIFLAGIENIKAFDILKIKDMNKNLKLIGHAQYMNNGFQASVQPTIIKENSMFSNVNMAFNSVIFKGNNVGDLMFYGPGAGKLPTANAVLSDVVDIALDSFRNKNYLSKSNLDNLNSKMEEQYYLRLPEDTDTSLLENILDRILSQDEYVAIITKEVSPFEILELISSLNINSNDYFLAKIEK